MRRSLKSAAAFVIIGSLILVVSAHDPRTTAKDFQAALLIEGTGKALIEYKAMHFNQATYDRMKANDQFRQRLSTSIWNNIGKASLDFDFKQGQDVLAKGSYTFGVDIGANDTFTLVFKNDAGMKKIPLNMVTGDNVSGEYLSINFTPTAEPDKFVIEARCGKFRGTQTLDVPDLASHDHPGEKPAEKPAPKP